MKRPLLLSLLGLLAAGPFPCSAQPEGYVAHEWGTFTSVQGSDGVVLRWNSLLTSQLPSFVHARNHPFNDPTLDMGAMMLEGKSMGLWLQRMETPVIYFYAQKEARVDVKVDFPEGHITEWFPQVSAYGPNPGLGQLMPASPKSFADWKQLTLLPAPKSLKPGELAADGTGSHYYAARETESALVRTSTGIGPKPKIEEEKFLFYRGVGNFQAPLSVEVGSGTAQVYLMNQGKEALRHLFLLEVSKGQAAFSKIDSLPPAAPNSAARFSPADFQATKETSRRLAEAMASSLVAEGLYPAEAAAMVKTWQDSWFEQDGFRVLYVLPRAWTDRVLPLAMNPAPRELVRVMVGRAEVFTPELERELQRSFVNYADPATRSQALDEIRQLNLDRFLAPAIIRLADLRAQETRVKVAEMERAIGEKTYASK